MYIFAIMQYSVLNFPLSVWFKAESNLAKAQPSKRQADRLEKPKDKKPPRAPLSERFISSREPCAKAAFCIFYMQIIVYISQIFFDMPHPV